MFYKQHVTRVLLHDGWHPVRGGSFEIHNDGDAVMLDTKLTKLDGVVYEFPGPWVSWVQDEPGLNGGGEDFYAPLSAVRAVHTYTPASFAP